MLKKIILILLLILNNNCSYKPVLATKNYDFQIININYQGEDYVNKEIEKKLIQNSNGDKEYDLNLFSKKEINIISSNTKGDPTKYSLKVMIKYEIIYDGSIILRNDLERQAIYNNVDDKFELSQKEENILENISSELGNEILMSIVNLNNDN